LSEIALGQSADTHFGMPKSRGAQNFRELNSSQPSLDDCLPAEHPVRLIAGLVDVHLDLVPIRAAYHAGRAAPDPDPLLMVRIMLYAYATGVCSSRAIERKCVGDVPFRWLADGTVPDYREIARFRKRYSSALVDLFMEALALCQAAGMARRGRFVLDPTSAPDGASICQVMRKSRDETKSVLAEQVWAVLTEAESIDDAEDAMSGIGNRGDESPERLRRLKSRLANVRQGNDRPKADGAPRAATKPKAQRALLGVLLLA